jgi:GGDEF domain-containing protein
MTRWPSMSLHEVARRLQLACDGTFVARIGGDES